MTPDARTAPGWKSFALGMFFLVSVAVVLLGVGIVSSGRAGKEFSPFTFERRTYSFYELPWLEIQLTPLVREDATDSLAKMLVKDKLLRPRPADVADRWDLIFDLSVSSQRGSHDAAVLAHFLDKSDGNGNGVWENWTNDHPLLAAELWPRVQTLAEDQLYIYTPDLFDLAEHATAPEQTAAALDARMVEVYLMVGNAQQLAGRHELAVHFYSRAIACEGQNVAALTGRAVSLDSQGKQEQAQADRAQVEHLRSKKT
ncbi:hypothetical protein [Lignipirellula cremea]|nr:hypothetical protein [Lignipirellula cremea]